MFFPPVRFKPYIRPDAMQWPWFVPSLRPSAELVECYRAYMATRRCEPGPTEADFNIAALEG